MRYDFIRQEWKAYSITMLCRTMEVSRSGFYNYIEYMQSRMQPNPTQRSLEEQIKTIFKGGS